MASKKRKEVLFLAADVFHFCLYIVGLLAIITLPIYIREQSMILVIQCVDGAGIEENLGILFGEML